MADTPYEVLAEFIKQETPYDDTADGANIALVGHPVNEPASVEKDGLLAANHVGAAAGDAFIGEVLTDDQQFKCLWWIFNGEQHRVTKALRLRYHFMQDGELKKTSLLIGYLGPSSE